MDRIREVYSNIRWRWIALAAVVPVAGELLDNLLTSETPFNDIGNIANALIVFLLLAGLVIYVSHRNALRKNPEKELRATEKNYRELFEQAPGPVELYAKDGLQLKVNRAYEEMWGFPRSTTVNKFNVLKSEEVVKTGLMKYVRAAYAGELVLIPEYKFDPRGVTESGGAGRVRWLSTRIYPIKDDDGRVTNIVIMHEDVTDRKEAEEKIRASEEKYRAFIENLSEVIISFDSECRHLFVSSNVADFVPGIKPEDYIGKTHRELGFDADMCDFWEGHIRRAFDTGKLVETEYRLDVDGRAYDFDWQLIPETGADGRVAAVLSVARDITVIKDAQERVKRLEALESLGTMAGGVAHDLNNKLGPLLGYPDLILKTLSGDIRNPDGTANDAIREYVKKMKESVIQVADEVHDLLALSRRAHYRMVPINLNDVVSSFYHGTVCSKLKSDFPGKRLELELDGALFNVKGSATHLTKVLMNLTINGFDAIPERGVLRIATRNIYIDKPLKGYDVVKKGEYVELTVEDDGAGIAEEHLGKIFEPFYSSKELGGSGSGLGLAVVHGVVSDHNGYVDVESKAGSGTSFKVYLPVSREETVVAPGALADIRGAESVLVIDDDEGQRTLAASVLGSLGYTVNAVSSGTDAIESIKDNPVDILVLDMIMDEMDGLDTYRSILELRPGQKAIIVSGFSLTERVREVQRLGAGPMLKKPYMLEEIGVALRRELDTP